MVASGYGAVDRVAKTGDSMTGTLTLTASTPLQVTTTGPGAGKVLVGDASGNVSWGTAGSAGVSAPLTLSSGQAAAAILSVTNTASAPSIAALVVTSQTAGDRSMGVQVAGDTNRRLVIDSTGVCSWGPGNAAGDVNLYRSGSGTLKTDNSLTVGGNLSVSGVGQRQYVIKGADQASTSTSMVNDNALTVPLVANATYHIQVRLSAINPVGNADIKTGWSAPTGTTGTRACWGPTAVSTGFTNRTQCQGRFSVDSYASASSATYQLDTASGTALIEDGVLTTTTAGNLAVQWGQNVSDTSNATTVQAASFMVVTRIA